MANTILVELFEVDADPDELDRATLALRRDLLEVDEVSGVRPAEAGPAPEGTRGLTLAALGALAVTAQPTIEVVVKVLGVVRAWLARAPVDRKMRVTINGQSIEFDPTQAQQEELFRAFVEAVSRQDA